MFWPAAPDLAVDAISELVEGPQPVTRNGSITTALISRVIFVIQYFPVRLFDLDPIRACSVVNKVEKLDSQTK